MNNLLQSDSLPVVLTLGAFWVGTLCQKKWKSAILNPILIGMAIVVVFLLTTGMDPAVYKAGTARLSWLMTPATISLAIPMYEKLQVLKKNGVAVAAGAIAGALTCILTLMAAGIFLYMDKTILISIMPKSVTAAIGVVLSDMNGGIGAVSTISIVITGVTANVLGVKLCQLFGITDPVAKGVAFGTSGHVIGTTKATEVSPLVGAVSSLSLVVAGLLTALIFPSMAGLV